MAGRFLNIVFTDETMREGMQIESADIPIESKVELLNKLSETGLPNRYYLAPEDVRVPLRPSTTRMRCPYKGESSYWNLALPDGTEIDDGAWSYPDPLPESARIAGRLSFVDGPDSRVTIEVDGRPA